MQTTPTYFRPLSGNYISQSCDRVGEYILAKSFPSPVGELHFSIIICRLAKNKGEISVPCRGTTFLNHIMFSHIYLRLISVPCRGTTFLNIETKIFATIRMYLQFPSPVGELHFSIVCILIEPITVFLFPSPVGELHFSIPSLQSRHQSGLMVGIAWEKYFWKNK